jgi:hypothetical protein
MYDSVKEEYGETKRQFLGALHWQRAREAKWQKQAKRPTLCDVWTEGQPNPWASYHMKTLKRQCSYHTVQHEGGHWSSGT